MQMHRPALVMPNPATAYLPYQAYPRIDRSVFVAPHAIVSGDVTIDQDAFVGFGAVVRGDWGPVYIGPLCNLHDHVTIHEQPCTTKKVGGYRYGVHLGERVSVLHGSGIHGPCRIGGNTFIGQMVNLFDAEVGEDCVILHGALLTNGVKIPSGRIVMAGQKVDTQEAADALPPVPDEYLGTNAATVRGYYELGRGYGAMLYGWRL